MNTKVIIAIVLLVIVLAVGGYFLFKPAAPPAVPAAPTVDEEAQFDAALALLGDGGGDSDLVEEFTTKECDDLLNNINRYSKMVEASNSIGKLKGMRDNIHHMDKDVLKFKDCPRVGPAYRNFKRMIVKKFQNVTKDLCSKMSSIIKQYNFKAKQAKNLAQLETIFSSEFSNDMLKVVEYYDLGRDNEQLIFTICPNIKNEYLSFMQVFIAKSLQFNPKEKKKVGSLCGSLKKLLAQVRSVKTQEQYNLVIDNLQRMQRTNGSLLGMCIEYWDIMLTLSPLHTKFLIKKSRVSSKV